MKNRSSSAAELARWFSQHKRQAPKEPWPVLNDPLEHLCLAILSENGLPHRCLQALQRLHRHVVDLNDLRVSTPAELALLLQRDVRDSVARATSLVRTLNTLYEKENKVSLRELKTKNKKERQDYLTSLGTLSPYAVACTLLMGFNDHVIPLDESMLQLLQKQNLVEADADLATVQQWLQKQINAKDARSFYGVLKALSNQKSVAGKMATRPAKIQKPKVAAKKRSNRPSSNPTK
ncbi:MAG: hypothetical protein HJJLKODD_02573 [Phycisphaerae bacterium]|nr:hypothetical protein [Phycisphaerae bacterium]